VLVGEACGLGAVLHAELAIDVRQVELHGLRRDPELLRDLVVRETACERFEDRELDRAVRLYEELVAASTK
jgi:hypothetical protein